MNNLAYYKNIYSGLTKKYSKHIITITITDNSYDKEEYLFFETQREDGW